MFSWPTGDPALPNSRPGEWFSLGRFAAILIFLIIAAFSDVIFGSRTFFYRDFGIFGHPLAFHHRESFWHGEIPLWNPFNNCGLPFLAQWNTMVVYPLSLFYVLFPLTWALPVFCLLHLFLAGLGMYQLARTWTGSRLAASTAGLAFAFNGLTLSCLKWPNNIAALAWMPFVVWLAERGCRVGGRNLVLAALVGALQMLTGGPEIILFTWILVGVLWLVEIVAEANARAIRTLRLLTIVALVAGLSSAQLLPFLDLLVRSQRDAGYQDASWSLPIWGWANFFVPLFRCFASHQGVFAQLGQYWISSYYPGVGVLALAALAVFAGPQRRDPKVWLLVIVAMASIILSFGEAGRVYTWMKTIIPPLQIVRFPVKFIVLGVFAVPLLSAFSMAEIDREPLSQAPPAWPSLKLIAAIAVVFSSVIATIVWFAWQFPLPTDVWSVTKNSGLSRVVLLVITLVVVVTLARVTQSKWRLTACGLMLLVWVDAMTHAPRLNPTIEPWVYEAGLARRELKWPVEPKAGISRAMVSPYADFRLNHLSLTNAVNDFLYSRMSLFANVNLLDEIPKVDGFFSLYIREESQARALLYASTNSNLPGLERFIGISQTTAPGKLIDWSSVSNYQAFATGGQKPIYVDLSTSLRAIADPGFDPAGIAYLPLEAQQSVGAIEAAKVEVKLIRFAAHRVELEVQASRPALFVLAQSYYHHWRAYIGDKPVPLWRANHFAQGLQVPEGHSVVRLVYEDRAFYSGVGLSGLTLLICLTLWFLKRRS